MIPNSKFENGDYVRLTIDGPYQDVTGVIQGKVYEQFVNVQTGEPADEWSWIYTVEFARGFPVATVERFLRRARIDE